MRTRDTQRWSVQSFPIWCALVVLAQICILRSLPYDLSGAGSNLWHFLACSSIGLLLWIAFDGNRIVSRVVFLIQKKAKPCAESSPR